MHSFQYKCRRCGEIRDASGISGNSTLPIAMVLNAMTNAQPKGGMCSIANFHLCSCKDGGTGVSDLVGFVTKVEEK